MRKTQNGMTLIGWAIILAILGVFALAAMRLIPIYSQKLEVYSLLDSLQQEFDGKKASVQTLKKSIQVKMQVKDISIIGHRDYEVTAVANGHQVRAHYEHKAPFLFDVGLFVTVDKTIEIRR